MELGTAMSFALLVTTSHYDITSIKLYLEVGMISKLFCEIIEASDSPPVPGKKAKHGLNTGQVTMIMKNFNDPR